MGLFAYIVLRALSRIIDEPENGRVQPLPYPDHANAHAAGMQIGHILPHKAPEQFEHSVHSALEALYWDGALIFHRMPAEAPAYVTEH